MKLLRPVPTEDEKKEALTKIEETLKNIEDNRSYFDVLELKNQAKLIIKTLLDSQIILSFPTNRDGIGLKHPEIVETINDNFNNINELMINEIDHQKYYSQDNRHEIEKLLSFRMNGDKIYTPDTNHYGLAIGNIGCKYNNEEFEEFWNNYGETGEDWGRHYRLATKPDDRTFCGTDTSVISCGWEVSCSSAELSSNTEEEITLLVKYELEKRRKKFEKIKKVLSCSNDKDVRRVRKAIPKEVKIYVWQRDQGKCIACGSCEELEYDHIIPVSKGGSNTERNIQLLCINCNRAKSSNIE